MPPFNSYTSASFSILLSDGQQYQVKTLVALLCSLSILGVRPIKDDTTFCQVHDKVYWECLWVLNVEAHATLSNGEHNNNTTIGAARDSWHLEVQKDMKCHIVYTYLVRDYFCASQTRLAEQRLSPPNNWTRRLCISSMVVLRRNKKFYHNFIPLQPTRK